MKIFVVSDIHGFYNELIEALDKAGFDKKNEEHWLVVCGDCFDRGNQPKEVMNYLLSLPRKTIIRGNHEDLLEEMCNRGYPYSHDKSNGTFNTVRDMVPNSSDFTNACTTVMEITHNFRESLVNYFETKNYVFVHGWIPCEKYSGKDTKPWWQMSKTYEYNPDWRNCNDVEWESARWTNGIKRGLDGITEPNKTIICGHWNCSHGYVLTGESDYEWEDGAVWDPFIGEGFIAIDRCTVHTGEVNVLIVEDDFLDTV